MHDEECTAFNDATLPNTIFDDNDDMEADVVTATIAHTLKNDKSWLKEPPNETITALCVMVYTSILAKDPASVDELMREYRKDKWVMIKVRQEVLSLALMYNHQEMIRILFKLHFRNSLQELNTVLDNNAIYPIRFLNAFA